MTNNKQIINFLKKCIFPEFIGITGGMGVFDKNSRNFKENLISFFEKNEVPFSKRGELKKEIISLGIKISNEIIIQKRQEYIKFLSENLKDNEKIILCGDYKIPRVVDQSYEVGQHEVYYI